MLARMLGAKAFFAKYPRVSNLWHLWVGHDNWITPGIGDLYPQK